MFKKLVAIEPVGLLPDAEKQLYNYAHEVVMHRDIPANQNEIAARIDNADAVLINYTSELRHEVLEKCENLIYVGMCCSLYSPESANVDIIYAREHGITVTGIRDYGDEGVAEYVIYELVKLLHGFGLNPNGEKTSPREGLPREITGLKTGIIGMGKTGGVIADALSFFGAEVTYYSRTKKKEAGQKGYKYLPLDELLQTNDVVFACLNKNTILLHEKEFEQLGNHKILFNTGLSAAWDEEPFRKWIEKDNICCCDSLEALGNKDFIAHPHVICHETSSGRTKQAFQRLSKKVLQNIKGYLQS
ncbi:MAG TPA: NAD(P)-dependent oxidoreductase [Prolixibacteraceae bacterium]|nr:NAD(P)-dependent oxidoreductase [Prolixibacteraceae bacterium]